MYLGIRGLRFGHIIGYCLVSHSSSASQTPETLNVLAESDVNASDMDHAARALQL